MTDSLFDLSGKVTLVTGGNSGLGLGFARGIARCGGDVVIWSRDSEKNAAAVAELSQFGGRVTARAVDVANEQEVIEGMQMAGADMGRLDCVVANAGISTQSSSFLDLGTDQYRSLLEINQHGAFYTLREAARHMVARAEADDPGGSLIICGSMMALRGVPGMQHYAAAKGALAAIMRCIAVEFAEHGIRANMIVPGFVVTAMTTGGKRAGTELAEKVDSMMAEKTPMKRVGYPADFEGIAAYLASDASSFQSGTVIPIDGGRAAAF